MEKSRRGVLVGTLAAACLGPVAGAGAQTKSFPANWFFDGRPPELVAHEGKAPPELKFQTWVGEKVSVPDSKGKVVVIDFWATWCGPCVASIPHNIEIVDRYKDEGLVFFGIHDSKSGWDNAPAMIREKKINYPVARDADGAVSQKAFHLGFWPTYVLIDRAGVVRGAGLNPQYLEEAVKVLLAEPAPPGLGGGGAAPGEFPAEWYDGGTRRQATLRAIEGKAMPELAAAEWIGEAARAEDLKGKVAIVHFFSSGSRPSIARAETLAALEKEMGAQGVVVVGVCPADDDWEAVAKLGAEGKLPTRVFRDAEASAVEGRKAMGATAGAMGIRFLPTTIVIDRAGVVRGAGVRVDRVKEMAGKLLAESARPREDQGRPDGG